MTRGNKATQALRKEASFALHLANNAHTRMQDDTLSDSDWELAANDYHFHTGGAHWLNKVRDDLLDQLNEGR